MRLDGSTGVTLAIALLHGLDVPIAGVTLAASRFCDMTELVDPARQVAYLLLDLISARDPDADDEVNGAALGVALPRLLEIDAVTATRTADGATTVNPTNLIAGALIALNEAVTQAAEAQGTDIEVIVANIREYLDSRGP